jgi:hypothetical protein
MGPFAAHHPLADCVPAEQLLAWQSRLAAATNKLLHKMRMTKVELAAVDEMEGTAF